MILLKQEEVNKLEKQTKELFEFLEKYIKKEYGSYLQIENEVNRKIYQKDLFEHFSERVIELFAPYLEELQNLELYESSLPNTKKSYSKGELLLNNRTYLATVFQNNQTFCDYFLNRKMAEFFLSSMNLSSSKDPFSSAFAKRIKEGFAELYMRRFCMNSETNLEFEKEYGYFLPTNFCVSKNKSIELALLLESKMKDPKMIFQSSYEEILAEYPSFKLELGKMELMERTSHLEAQTKKNRI